MATTEAELNALLEEQRVLLRDVPWSTYVVLRDSVDSPAVRMTYLHGLLEIMSPSKRHEDEKKMMGRLLELFVLEKGVRLYAHGSVTLRQEMLERGLEPDECYCRGEDKDIPDLAIEVVVSPPRLDKLEVYRGLGIGEVWTLRKGAVQVHVLRSGAYVPSATSVLFPEVDLVMLAQFAQRKDQPEAVLEFRDRIRGH